VANSNKNCAHKEIKKKYEHLGNVCCQSVQNSSSYNILYGNVNAKICRTGCETWPLTLGVEFRLRGSEISELRGINELKREGGRE
jgi:hypothetical protein